MNIKYYLNNKSKKIINIQTHYYYIPTKQKKNTKKLNKEFHLPEVNLFSKVYFKLHRLYLSYYSSYNLVYLNILFLSINY
jgi:hypothetical protein